MALLLLAGLSQVPDELHEAARVDGASAWQRFWRITVPLIKPAILVALLFRTLDAFRIFDTIFVLTASAQNRAIETVSNLGYNPLLNQLNLGVGSAISVLIFSVVGADRRSCSSRCSAPIRSRGDLIAGRKHRRLGRRQRRSSSSCALFPVFWILLAVAQEARGRRRRPADPGSDLLRELRRRSSSEVHLHRRRCATRSASR